MPSLTISSEGYSEPIILREYLLPFQASAAVFVPDDVEANYTLEMSLGDNLWLPEPSMTEQSRTSATELSVCAKVRVHTTHLKGGPLELQVLQAGPRN